MGECKVPRKFCYYLVVLWASHRGLNYYMYDPLARVIAVSDIRKHFWFKAEAKQLSILEFQ